MGTVSKLTKLKVFTFKHLNWINSRFKTYRLAVDFGTANCVILDEYGNILLNEPTVVAIDPSLKKIISVGSLAKDMLGRVPQNLEARRPLKYGGISNYRLAQVLLMQFIKNIIPKYFFGKLEALVSVPVGISSVEERALIKVFKSVGFSKIILFPEPMAAAIGANMLVDQPRGNLIVNLGGGTAEIAVISLNGLVSYESLKGCGDLINEEIIWYVKQKYNTSIGEVKAEQVKIKIGDALPTQQNSFIEVTGKHNITNMHFAVKLSSDEIQEAIHNVLNKIVESIKIVISKTSPELISDIAVYGGILSGGTALLNNIDIYFAKILGFPITVTDDPIMSVSRGLVKVLNNLDNYSNLLK